MKQVTDRALNVKGSEVHVRSYIDPQRRHQPVIVVEEARQENNPGIPLEKNRGVVAEDLAARVGVTPDKITYLEQRDNGDLAQYTFAKSPVTKSASPTETPAEWTVAKSHHVSRREMEAQVGQPLESHVTRQNQDFQQLRGPKPGFEPER